MQAIVLEVNRKNWSTTKGYVSRDVEAPRLEESQNPSDANAVLVAPIFGGVCGTDKGIWFRKIFKESILSSLERERFHYRIAGHEMLGKITALGSNVKRAGGLRIGEIVSTESHLYCGECSACANNNRHVCLKDRIIGVTAHGCFAQSVKLPANTLWPTDLDKIRPEVGAIQEPFGNAVHACLPFEGASLKGKNIAIFGCGAIGLFSVLVARSLGAKKILCVEPNKANGEKAKQMGANHVMAPLTTGAKDATGQAVLDYFDGIGADYCLEMSGHPTSFLQALVGSARGGNIVLFGVSSGALEIPSFEQYIKSGKRIFPIIGRRIFSTWEQTKEILEDKSNGVQESIWKYILNEGKGTIPFHEFHPPLFEEKIRTYSKVLIDFR